MYQNQMFISCMVLNLETHCFIMFLQKPKSPPQTQSAPMDSTSVCGNELESTDSDTDGSNLPEITIGSPQIELDKQPAIKPTIHIKDPGTTVTIPVQEIKERIQYHLLSVPASRMWNMSRLL